MKKILSLVLSLTMILTAAPIVASAEGIGVNGEGTATGSSPSDFSVDSDIIGTGATVVIPASLPLTYNESTDSYQVASSVGVYGDMQEHMSVRVSTPSIALYRQDGVVSSGYSSMSIPAPEIEDEEYPYTYAIKWNTFASKMGYGSYVTKYNYEFKSKVQLFWAANSDSANTVCMYIYKDGNYVKADKFYKSGAPGSANTYVTPGEVSYGTTLSDNEDVILVNKSVLSYYSDGSFKEDESANQHYLYPQLTADNSTDYQNVNASLGLDNKLYCSGMVFENALAGLAWMSAHDGVDAEALENDDTIAGHVRFGEVKDGICYANWNAAEMAEGVEDDHADMKTVPLIITVASHNIEDVGDYEANIEFTIQSACIGMYSDVTVASQNGDNKSGVNRNYSNSNKRWALSFNDTSITSYNFTQLTPDENVTEVTMHAAMNVSNSVSINGFKTSAANVKYIQMNTSDFLKYQVSIDLDYINKTNNWLRGVYNLKVLVLDSNFNADLITYESGNGGYDGAQDPDTCFYGTTAPVGNALIFMKDLTDDGYFVYVPHIAYRGTMAQWKAASGESDWIFGNAYNTVTVHCTDGTLEY